MWKERSMNEVRVGEIRIGKGNPLVLIAGPCVLEGEAITLEIAKQLKELCGALKIPFIFKASLKRIIEVLKNLTWARALKKG